MQRKLHPLEGIVAICALLFVLFVSVGFAQAQDVQKIALRSSSALVLDAGTGEVVALKRLRQRYRELAESELAETVANATDLDAEREALARALGQT